MCDNTPNTNDEKTPKTNDDNNKEDEFESTEVFMFRLH